MVTDYIILFILIVAIVFIALGILSIMFRSLKIRNVSLIFTQYQKCWGIKN